MNNLLHGKTKKERKIVRDHYLSPQFIARFILDNQEIYLSDYSKFKKMFYISCGIVIVTQDENDRLAQLTKSSARKIYFIYSQDSFSLYASSCRPIMSRISQVPSSLILTLASTLSHVIVNTVAPG